ncbi:hypothetical protein [Streptomyces sp. NA02950]|nr:hypothetical protein [Streptomyces sp. NA02950]
MSATWGAAIARSVSGQPADTDPGDPGPTRRWEWDGLQGDQGDQG